MIKANLYFEIQADDTERAINFYTEVFGWLFTRQEGMPIAYWQIDTGGSRGGLLKRPAPKPPEQSGTNAFCCSVEVDSFDDTAETIQKSGGTVAMPKFPVYGKCWQGYFLDTEGNVFGLFEVDEQAGK